MERRICRRLSPSYRAFLHEHDGWPLFFEGASLLGTRELSKPGYAELTRATFAAYETPIPEVGPPSRPQGSAEAMIPFGMDPNATTIFRLQSGRGSTRRRDGSHSVVNELGERTDCFGDFLSMVLEMLEVDVEERRRPLKKSA